MAAAYSNTSAPFLKFNLMVEADGAGLDLWSELDRPARIASRRSISQTKLTCEKKIDWDHRMIR
jgi:hypothetical protein